MDWPPLEISKSRLGRHLPGSTQVLSLCFRTDGQVKPAPIPVLFLFNDFFFLIKHTSSRCCSGSYHSIFSFIIKKNAFEKRALVINFITIPKKGFDICWNSRLDIARHWWVKELMCRQKMQFSRHKHKNFNIFIKAEQKQSGNCRKEHRKRWWEVNTKSLPLDLSEIHKNLSGRSFHFSWAYSDSFASLTRSVLIDCHNKKLLKA